MEAQQDFKELLALLNEHKVEYVIVRNYKGRHQQMPAFAFAQTFVDMWAFRGYNYIYGYGNGPEKSGF